MYRDGRIPPVSIPIPGNITVASTSATDSAASSDVLFGEYDVFLSFHGADTRKGFADVLYNFLDCAGVCTFRDNEGLHVGKEIGPELLKAIKDSKILIPIFSKNYASSKWCLMELVHMAQCQAEGEQMIFPIFYDVDPHDVRNQRSSYEEAFHQHKESFDSKTIQGWKEALTKVGKLKGLELTKETDGRQGELAKVVLEKVQGFLKQTYYHESPNLVGMDNHMKKMEELINSNFDGVRFIGIHGMGGLGKTTIARTIYDLQLQLKLFECHCFLEDVRENSKTRIGMVGLQNQLLSNITKIKMSDINGIDEGIQKIKYAVRGKKVFIVLDDVDQNSQIDKLAVSYRWLGAGSRIIITTRNENVLRVIEKTCLREGQLDVYRSYNPDIMGHNDSLLLFSKYAFMSDCPPEGYEFLSKKFVSAAAGLPLVIVTLGSSLFGEEDKDLWEEKLRKLEEVPDEEVLEKLRISFDPLSDEEKQIFLDIACFFIGEDKRNPCYMWDDCNFFPLNGLKVLVCRSLITVGDDGILRMHDQLRDLGRRIVREGNLSAPGSWSRIWRNYEALGIVEKRQGTMNVEALSVNLKYQACLVGEDFGRLQNLRYLKLQNADLDGDFKYILSNLRWLRWSSFSATNVQPRNLRLENLVILDISHRNIKDDWDLWSQIKGSKRLKVLDLSFCERLRKVPYLSTHSNLERLNVSCCSSLRDLKGIEKLESLRYLDATSCHLNRLPNLSKLRKLAELDVSECEYLRDIPGLDKLESLEVLNIRDCRSLERLPNLSNLKKLKTLDASFESSQVEIEGLGAMKSLEYLDISGHYRCKTLSDLSNLKRLRVLTMGECLMLTEIHGLEGLESLEHLDMFNCLSLKRLPDLSNLKGLKTLDLTRCLGIVEIQDLQRLESLEHLDMTCCTSLERLSDLPKSLELLDISGCMSIENLPDLSNLKKLKEINATNCAKLTEIRGIEQLQSLTDLYVLGCKSLIKLGKFPDTKIHQHYKDKGITRRLVLTPYENPWDDYDAAKF